MHRELQKPRQYMAEYWTPMPSLFESPAIDVVANEIEVLRLDCVEQREKRLSLRIAATQMNVSQENTSRTRKSRATVHVGLVQDVVGDDQK